MGKKTFFFQNSCPRFSNKEIISLRRYNTIDYQSFFKKIKLNEKLYLIIWFARRLYDPSDYSRNLEHVKKYDRYIKMNYRYNPVYVANFMDVLKCVSVSTTSKVNTKSNLSYTTRQKYNWVEIWRGKVTKNKHTHGKRYQMWLYGFIDH